MLKYKKPAFWIILAAIVICIVVAVCFLTNSKTEEELSIAEADDEIEESEPPISDEADETSEAESVTSVAADENQRIVGSKFVYRYNKELGGIVITKYLGEDEAVIIPKTFGDRPIVEVGYGAFSGKDNVTSITIPDGVISIAALAFKYCENLTDITIPGSVTSIGDAAFHDCPNLKKVTISDGVMRISSYAFQGCTGLESIELPDSVIFIGHDAFDGCDKLRVTYKGQTYNASDFDDLYSLFGYMREQTADVESDAEQAARAAYTAFLSGDVSMVDDAKLKQSWVDFYLPNSELEYTFLDLDGDGVSELLVQWVDDPGSMNATFHYSDGKLFYWNFDTVEMTSWESPLQNGIMVYQYHYGGSSTWSGFRYLSNGEAEHLFSFFARYEVWFDDDTSKVPYYEVDRVEVDQETFDREFKKRITDQELERSAWTPLPQ